MVDSADGRTLTPQLQVVMISLRLYCGLGSLLFAYKFMLYHTLPVWMYLASFMTMVGIRSWRSRSSVLWTMQDELTCVLKDVFGTPCTLFYNLGRDTNYHNKSNNNSSKYDSLRIKEWLMWLSTLSMYKDTYGPFSSIFMTLFVLPINVLNAVWADSRGLNLMQSVLVFTRFIFLAFGFMQFFTASKRDSSLVFRVVHLLMYYLNLHSLLPLQLPLIWYIIDLFRTDPSNQGIDLLPLSSAL